MPFLAPFSFLAALQAPAVTELTIYNGGFGFVKEVRDLNLRAGRQTVAVEDVPALIEANSVNIRSLTDPNGLSVLEQNYRYDLISRTAILNKSVGGTVRLNRVLPNGQKEMIEGTLLSAPTAIIGQAGNQGQQYQYNGLVIRTTDGRILLDPTGELEVLSIPKGLISRPTLFWDLEAKKSGNDRIELSYLTQGMNWSCDYVMTLDAKSNEADFRGWVTLNNNSGKTFEGARLKLMAGEVNRTPTGMGFGGGGMGGGGRGMDMAKAAAFQEESLFEYHLYTLQRPADVANNEMKQVGLLETSGVPYAKKIIVDSMAQFRQWIPQEGSAPGTGDIQPQVRVEFANEKDYGLGVPLPKGRVKVYQRDGSGSVQMLGEDQIEHTPNREKLSLAIGRSFDIRATRKRMSFKLIGGGVEEEFEIEVRNRKETPETVHVYERHWWDWTIRQESVKSTKLDANTSAYVLNMKPNEVTTIKYTIFTNFTMRDR